MSLTPQQALDMINRSAITGVPTSEFNAAGGYDAVMSLAKQAGWNGAPSQQAVAQYGGQVAETGVGNWAYAPPPTNQAVTNMANNGIDLSSIQNIVSGFQNGSLGSNYYGATGMQNPTQPPAWLNDMQSWWQSMQQQQQAPATANSSYTSQAFPQYTPQGSNALMRPITQGSNITAQNQYGNMGYNNQRSSLWGDW
jgi:hypothetical protein